jgi:hypothetical protein
MSAAVARYYNPEYNDKVYALIVDLEQWLPQQPRLTEDMTSMVAMLRRDIRRAVAYDKCIPLYREALWLLSKIIVFRQHGDFASRVSKLFNELFDNGLFDNLEMMILDFLFMLRAHGPHDDAHEDDTDDEEEQEDDEERVVHEEEEEPAVQEDEEEEEEDEEPEE